ncbi:glutathione peroxidase [Acidovorax sp. SUPP3334]|uniref:glutathione peroxidase n=1 Tax=Acidovorax sp. SUPP3334 TaxID=2920881 RepID=UPI0023DE67BA|nr:glutathione peroxidase [Acidovorax sp. SUPP3334]GKT22859.1 glutathione peroxidase [Acidovorax sp. SUPP3334]
MLRRLVCLALAAVPLALSSLPARAAGPTVGTEDGTCPPLLRHTPLRLQDELPQPLCQYRNRVLLIVNTASYCGFTGQYQGLEALHTRYKDRGFTVLGFPSNDFSQEGGSNAQIADFCESTFGVKFPMFAKSRVKGADASPLYLELKAQSGESPRWNFHKYLVGRDGKVVGSFASAVEPGDPRLVRAIEQQLTVGR